MNKIFRDPFIFICAGLLLFFASTFFSFLWEDNPAGLLNEAQESYIAAEHSQDAQERIKGFNHALEIFLELEKKYAPTFGNGKLYFDIGNSFFQLAKTSHALLYYYRAQQLRPRDPKVESHVLIAENKLTVPHTTPSSLNTWFAFHTRISLPERLQLFFACGMLLLFFYSWYMWQPHRWLKIAAWLCCIPASFLALSLFYSYAFSPIEAVILKSSQLYRDGGFQFATVKREPLLPGIKVKVIDHVELGKWLKVQTNDGIVGFLPAESLQMI